MGCQQGVFCFVSFVNVGESAELFLTAWKPLLPVELEVVNEPRECRGIGGIMDDPWTIEPHVMSG